MKTYAIRLHPGQDLKQELVKTAASLGLQAGIILTCVGSLNVAGLRLANQPHTSTFPGKFEIVSLVGTLSPDGPHLHISLADSQGRLLGGHLQDGCQIYTTAEIVIGELEEVTFRRPLDPQTGYDELVIEG